MIELKLIETASATDLREAIQLHYKKFIDHIRLRRYDGAGPLSLKAAFDKAKQEFREVNSWVPWAINTLNGQGRTLTQMSKPIQPYTDYHRGCYYNALSYVNQHPGYDLAVGIVLYRDYSELVGQYQPLKDNLVTAPSSLNARSLLHGFAVNGTEIIDPTLGLAESGNPHLFRIIPRAIWSKIKWKPNSQKWPGFDEIEKIFLDQIKTEYQQFNVDAFLKGALSNDRA